MSDKPKQYANLVLAGKCRTTDNKAGVIFHRVADDGTVDSKTLIFTGKNFAGLGIGNVYQFEIEESETGLSVYAKTQKFIRQHTNRDQVIEWRTLADAAEIAARLEREEKKASSDQVFRDALKPIIDAYRKTDYRGRLAIEAMVLSILRKR